MDLLAFYEGVGETAVFPSIFGLVLPFFYGKNAIFCRFSRILWRCGDLKILLFSLHSRFSLLTLCLIVCKILKIEKYEEIIFIIYVGCVCIVC